MNERQKRFPRYLDGINAESVDAVLRVLDVSTRKRNDGRDLNIYRAGNPESDCLILLPPVGISFMLTAKLAVALSKDFYVLTWEAMGCPDCDIPFWEDDLSLERQAEELELIIKHNEISRFHLAGWCQAAQLIIQVASRAIAKPESLCLIAPAGLGCSVLKSEFERCALPIYLQIEQKGVEYAGKIRTILDKLGDQPISEINLAEKLSLVHLLSPEATFLYSKYVKSFKDNKAAVNTLLETVMPNSRVLLIHSMDDNFSHYSESVQLSKRFPAVSLEVMPRGGHLVVFNAAEKLAKTIIEFIARV